MGPKTTETIRTLKHPRNTTKLRCILSLCNVYRRFVSNFARKTAPWNELLETGRAMKFNYNGEGEAAVERLRRYSINPQILGLSTYDASFTTKDNACDEQGSCDLSQPQYYEKDHQPIGY